MDWEEGKKYEKKEIEKALAYMREHPLTHEQAVEQTQRLKEKAKNMTREEAIKEAYGIPVNKKQHEALQILIPELAESEDERSRKWIVNLLHELHYNQTAQPMALKALAYLEKQKEQKPVNHNLTTFHRDVVYCAMCNKNLDEGLRYNLEIVYNVLKDIVAQTPIVCEQKEQKHPDGCFTCDEYKKGYEEGRRNGFTAGYNKAIKEVEHKEQRPAEWSEEDERMLSRCVKSIEASKQFADSDTFKLAKDKEIVWFENRFKFLSPQPKQELSEEEFETFRKTLAKDAFLDEITSIRVAKKLLNSVKSLRPSWKPSEVQMEALSYAIDDYTDFKEDDERDALYSLYEQLKKLM